MNAIATIKKPGLQTTIQDAGRPGTRHLGVPHSGAADRVSFALTNAAADNPWNTPALECTLLGPSLEFSSPCGFALGGADMEATLNGAHLELYRHYKVQPGDLLALGSSKLGARCYIAFTGGITGNAFLGSISTYLPARIGGNGGHALRENDIIETAGDPTIQHETPDYLRPIINHDWMLRATPGPETEAFDPKTLRQFYSTKFTADQHGNRMGMRLTGAAIGARALGQMKSSAVFPGTVQCPPDGAPFLLLSDAQTVGGYPRIAQVITADLHLTGQIRPGDHIWFIKTGAASARDIAEKKTAFFASTMSGFRLD